MVSRFFACAGVGGFFTLAASILAIFAHIGQISDNIVPRNIRMVSINTSGVGQASGAGTSVYGSGARNSPNTGLRQYYQWGLWNYCEKNDEGGVPDFCSGTSWANSFQPLPAILYDVPSASQTQVANVLPSSTFTDTDYLSSYSKAAFYLLIIGTILGGLALIVGFLAHRFAYLLAALFCLLGFLCTAVGCVIWTVIIAKVRSGINDGGSGLYVSYGDGLWIYWAASGCLLAAILPNIFSCIAGRDRDYYY